VGLFGLGSDRRTSLEDLLNARVCLKLTDLRSDEIELSQEQSRRMRTKREGPECHAPRRLSDYLVLEGQMQEVNFRGGLSPWPLLSYRASPVTKAGCGKTARDGGKAFHRLLRPDAEQGKATTGRDWKEGPWSKPAGLQI
jgi:hypothetical protein